MKANKLYTVDKYSKHLFADAGPMEQKDSMSEQDKKWDLLASAHYGASYGDKGSTLKDYKNHKNFLGISRENNPFSKGNIRSTVKTGGHALATAAGPMLNSLLSNGMSSDAGKAVAGIGSTVGAALGPGIGTAIGLGSQVVGGAINNLIGMKTNQAALKANNATISANNSITSNAANFDGVARKTANANYQKTYSGGILNKKAGKMEKRLKARYTDSNNYANRAIASNVDAITKTQMTDALAHYSAFGGPIDLSNNDNMGVINYDMMTDYLNTKKNQSQSKGNMIGYLGGTPNNTLFALGGDIQSNGSDWSNGLKEVNAGSSHEENPYEGVQMGIAPDNEPNLVEEGETIYNDFVFSNRIKPTREVLKKFHMYSKNSKLTYADVSKKLQKESLERPNDPISRNALDRQLSMLAECQEQQKAEMEAQEAREIFESLSPEEQKQLIAQMFQQQQMEAQAQEQQQEVQPGSPEEQQMAEQQAAQEQAMQEQAMQEQMMQQGGQQGVPVDENGNPIDPRMMQDVQYAANGGHLGHKFGDGGTTTDQFISKLANELGLYTEKDFKDWAEKERISSWFNLNELKTFYDFNRFNKQYLKEYPAFLIAIKQSNPALAHAISQGYDFGRYMPGPVKGLTFDFLHGGWGKEDSNSWYGSTDAAWQELMQDPLKYGLDPARLTAKNKNPYSSAEVGKALSRTEAYKAGTRWLKQAPENMLMYLNAIYNSKDAPKAARDYAAKWVDGTDWKSGITPNYTTIFEDPNGLGVRNTHPGTYWKTPKEMLRENKVNKYLKVGNEWVPIVNDDVSKFKQVASYYWDTEKNGIQNMYFEDPNAVSSEDLASNTTVKDKNKPKMPYKDERLRYLPMAGPILSSLLRAAGVGKPDLGGLDAAMEAASNNKHNKATWKPIGNYVHAVPYDIWRLNNRLDANMNAANRIATNMNAPTGTKLAGTMGNLYTAQLNYADNYAKMLDTNFTNYMKASEFNKDTDKYNADAFTKTSHLNAELGDKAWQFKANLAADIAKYKAEALSGWNKGWYTDISNLFNGLGNLGRENAEWNRVAYLANNGVTPTLADRNNDVVAIGGMNPGKSNTEHKSKRGGKLMTK